MISSATTGGDIEGQQIVATYSTQVLSPETANMSEDSKVQSVVVASSFGNTVLQHDVVEEPFELPDQEGGSIGKTLGENLMLATSKVLVESSVNSFPVQRPSKRKKQYTHGDYDATRVSWNITHRDIRAVQAAVKLKEEGTKDTKEVLQELKNSAQPTATSDIAGLQDLYSTVSRLIVDYVFQSVIPGFELDASTTSSNSDVVNGVSRIIQTFTTRYCNELRLSQKHQ